VVAALQNIQPIITSHFVDPDGMVRASLAGTLLLDVGPARIKTLRDGRLMLTALDPRYQAVPLVYDFVAATWVWPPVFFEPDDPLVHVECGPHDANDQGLFTSCWSGVVGDELLTLGAGQAGADPTQGVLLVGPGVGLAPDAPTARLYRTPQRAGPVRIVRIGNGQVILAARTPAYPPVTFAFDLRSRRWVSPPQP
jgi:hypothetical protein